MKKEYKKPAVVYEQTLEVLAGVCTDDTGSSNCKADGACTCLSGS